MNIESLRDTAEKMVTALAANDIHGARVYMDNGVIHLAALGVLYGDNLEGLEIPDGFFDKLSQRSRVTALVGLFHTVLRQLSMLNED